MDNEIKHIIGRIKNSRERLGYSYQDLAEKTGLSKSTLQRYETGFIKNIPIQKLEVLASALEVTPNYLMGWISTTPSYSTELLTSLQSVLHESSFGGYNITGLVEYLEKELGIEDHEIYDIVNHNELELDENTLDIIEKHFKINFPDKYDEFKKNYDYIEHPYRNDEIHTIAAHHEGEEWTDDELDEIEAFKQFVKSKRKQ